MMLRTREKLQIPFKRTSNSLFKVSAVPPRRSAVLAVFHGATAINDGTTAFMAVPLRFMPYKVLLFATMCYFGNSIGVLSFVAPLHYNRWNTLIVNKSQYNESVYLKEQIATRINMIK